MTTESYAPRTRDARREGVVSMMSTGHWGRYHRLDCGEVADRGQPGVRSVIHGPWRYLGRHWYPCPACRPPSPD